MTYHIRRIEKNVSVEALMPYYQPTEVEGYCKSCPNYNRIWSCPPHDFTGAEFLAPYKEVKLIAEVITPIKDADLLDCFQQARRTLGDELMALADVEQVNVLIAGNCYQCLRCAREVGEPCVRPERCKYSLESVGFLVAEIADKILDEPLKWGDSQNKPQTLMTVAAVLYK